jgi:hypothetical protein
MNETQISYALGVIIDTLREVHPDVFEKHAQTAVHNYRRFRDPNELTKEVEQLAEKLGTEPPKRK